jgi:uncharacterized protein (UPF0210 family)
MKIRTITCGTDLSPKLNEKNIAKLGTFLQRARRVFENEAIPVQTVRLTSQAWSSYLAHKKLSAKISYLKDLEALCREYRIDFASVGSVVKPSHIKLIPTILSATSIISTSALIGTYKSGIDFQACTATAKAILEISRCTPKGFGNFRFAGIANCPPDIPFFPASYHKGKTCFSIGLECSDLVVKAFKKVKIIQKTGYQLKKDIEESLKKIIYHAEKLSKKEKIFFKGIDVSPAPSLKKDESIVRAFEGLRFGKFGRPGTLAIAVFLTRVLKSLAIKKCGYSGLMLPILEDHGLAQKWGRGEIDIETLLACSSVCGTGLDCIPLPGNVSENKLYALLLDVAALATRLDKPLSARLFPVPGKKAGEQTRFNSPYLIDCKIIDI